MYMSMIMSTSMLVVMVLSTLVYPQPACEAVLWAADSGNCYRKGQINVWRCSHDSHFDLHILDA
jgi:hypothetical protein